MDALKQDEIETPVIFRRFKEGDVIALFPLECGTSSPYTCGSYQHVGQHGAADPGIVYCTTPAQDDAPDVVALRTELETYPFFYRLRPMRRFPRDALAKRRTQILNHYDS